MNENFDAIVLLPRLLVQNANAISSPLTWGFPAPSAFTGFAHALQRRLVTDGRDLRCGGVAIVCHDFKPQVFIPPGSRTQVFRLTRNPVDKNGRTPALVEEGRTHLDVSLMIAVSGNGCPVSDVECNALTTEILSVAQGMRLAGGSIIPHPKRARYPPRWLNWPDDHDSRLKSFRKLRSCLLPGFALVSRADLLACHLDTVRLADPQATALDALLDLCRLNIEPDTLDDGNVNWVARRPYPGWLVPLPAGYAAISPPYEPEKVANARDDSVPFRFVESVLTLGEWISPHRISQPDKLFWHHDAQPESGLYLLHNPYSLPEHGKLTA